VRTLSADKLLAQQPGLMKIDQLVNVADFFPTRDQTPEKKRLFKKFPNIHEKCQLQGAE
jgi:hypothetical protein